MRLLGGSGKTSHGSGIGYGFSWRTVQHYAKTDHNSGICNEINGCLYEVRGACDQNAAACEWTAKSL